VIVQPRRVSILSPNYAPEFTGIPVLVTDAARWLSERGHLVNVVTAMPSYPHRRIFCGYEGRVWCSESDGKIRVERVRARVRERESVFDKAMFEASFGLMTAPRMVKDVWSSDVVVCVIPSLVAGIVTVSTARLLRILGRHTRVVLWVQDLVLEAARALGGGELSDATLRRLRALEQFAIEHADAVVACSGGFAKYYAQRGAASRIHTVHNWVDVDTIRPSDPASPIRVNGRTAFLYAGNIGYTQGLETAIEAVRGAGDWAQLTIVGAGNDRDRIIDRATEVPNVEIRPPVPDESFPGLLASADVHLVIQRRAIAGANLPSKIGVYLASGRPLLASIDDTTPAADLLRRSCGSIIVPPEDPVRLRCAMRRLHEDVALRRRMAEAGRNFAVRQLSRATILPRLEAAILG
jgi:colanic acid biosynthesis glycosyl transferase WcaI